jgi:hypothetical protein
MDNKLIQESMTRGMLKNPSNGNSKAGVEKRETQSVRPPPPPPMKKSEK